MSDIRQNIDIKIGSEKSFGYFFSLIFIIIAFFPLIKDEQLRLWSLLCSLVLLLITFLVPGLLKKPNQVWAKFGILIGQIVSPFVMLIIYILGVLPIGLFLKIAKKDILNTKYNDKAKTYWIKKENMESMKNQF